MKGASARQSIDTNMTIGVETKKNTEDHATSFERYILRAKRNVVKAVIPQKIGETAFAKPS